VLFQADPVEVENLPQEIRERFPEVVEDLRNGVIDDVPERVLDQLPPSVVDRIPEGLLASDIDTTFVIILVALAAVSFLGFGWGMVKAATKAALFFLVIGAVAAVLLYAQI
jgi:hypothetical protein